MDVQLPRQEVIEILTKFAFDENTHGQQHARVVEATSKVIAQDPEYTNINIDLDVLSAAALLHDIGYSQFKPTWRPGQTEHVMESVNIAKVALKTIAPFDNNPDKLRLVCFLIKHHDDTNHAFPIYQAKKKIATPISSRDERSEWPYLELPEFIKASAMLKILKEADARTSTGYDGAIKTLDYSLSRGLTLLSPQSQIDSWCWEVSAIGNVRLGAKRALLDAYTSKGKRLAWQGYLDTERLIREKTNSSYYQSEIHAASLEKFSPAPNYNGFWIRRIFPWDVFVNSFRSIKLRGDRTLLPYQNAVIECKMVDIDELKPTAYYVSTTDIQKVEQLHDNLLRHYCFSLFDLPTMIEITNYRSRKGRYDIRTTPPIVEAYAEKKGRYEGEHVLALVDGLHRCFVAKLHGFTRIRAIVISNIPENMPLVPLPLSWNDVKVFDGIPHNKREYRYTDISEFPDISSFSSVEVNADNYKYFFYRDLKPIGSEGIRESLTRKTSK